MFNYEAYCKQRNIEKYIHTLVKPFGMSMDPKTKYILSTFMLKKCMNYTSYIFYQVWSFTFWLSFIIFLILIIFSKIYQEKLNKHWCWKTYLWFTCV